MSETGLKTATCKEQITYYQFQTTGDIMERIEQNFEQATVLTLFKDTAKFGKYADRQIEYIENEKLEYDRIEEMRIFDPKKELYIWRENDHLKGRLREDNDETGTKETEYVISNLILWGTRAKTEKPGWTTLKEERGIEYTVPYTPKRIDEQHPLRIKIHTYIEYIDEIQASYTDSRFVEFTEGGE